MIDGLDHTHLVNFAARLVGRQDAEDVVQSVYLKWLAGEIPPCRGDASRTTWLLSVVKHTAIRWRSKNDRAYDKPRAYYTNQDSGELRRLEKEASYTPDYDTAIDTARSVATLSAMHQTVLHGFAEHGGYTSLAAALGLTRGQVRGRLYRARRKLRAQR